MSSKDKIKQLRRARLHKMSGDNNTDKRHTLAKIVEKYGYDNVMEASGWKQSTIAQYLRNPNSTISSENLNLTVEVLREAFEQ